MWAVSDKPIFSSEQSLWAQVGKRIAHLRGARFPQRRTIRHLYKFLAPKQTVFWYKASSKTGEVKTRAEDAPEPWRI